MQVSIGGFGPPVTVWCVWDRAAKILAVAAESPLMRERREGCVVISNVTDVDRDRAFDSSMISRAIDHYWTLSTGVAVDGVSRQIVYADKAQRLSPESAVERDRIGVDGPIYQLSDTVTSGHVAVLAAADYAMESGRIDAAIDMADMISRLANGMAVTI